MEVPADKYKEYFFLTATLVEWVPLFIEQHYASIVLNSLAYLRAKEKMTLYAFVVMPTHLHAIISPGSVGITEIIQNFGSFTAHAIVKELIKEHRGTELAIFENAVVDNMNKYRIWQKLDSKPIFTEYVLMQELEYLHNNPTRKKWNLVEDRAEYLNSSARFYDLGKPCKIEIDDVRSLLSGLGTSSQRGR